ncbi:hypothetical protein DRJ17_02440 [Candidatus Woesearchaeota archaeon]|nr:MAG: hypothetical protein DRJ17_02440 [Candidatus Woesearchaeota archaeon]
MTYYDKPLRDVFLLLGTNKHGLTSEEAAIRIEKYGLNEIIREKKISKLKIFFSQFKSFIIYILIFAFFVSIIIGLVEHSREEIIDAAVIFAILILNALLGFFQEYKAEKSIEALKKLASLKARVIRDGKEQKIDAKEVVPGDILVLAEGDKVPADARLIRAINLETQEASLTGESTPVEKHVCYLENKPIAEQSNMVFSSTIITRGKGLAVVTATGMKSEIGKIATMIQETEEIVTPLQQKLKQLGKLLSIAVIGICLIVFFTGILSGNSIKIMFLAAIGLAVAAVPEGLPAVVTISLSLGVRRLIKRNALIRKLPSVETLGSTTVICADKTGTLTHNQMTVKKLFVNNKVIDVTGSGYKPEGEFLINGKLADPKDYDILLRIGALCNDAKIENEKVIGDPTEAALIISAQKAEYSQKTLNTTFPRIDEIPFESSRKMMSTIHDDEGKCLMLTKGAPDILLQRCTKVLINGKEQKMTVEYQKKIIKQNEEFACKALRVLGFAYRYLDGPKTEDNLVFVGLQAMIDPPRQEVREAIAKCKSAGIKVVMITGDHLTTAIAIARELGIEGKAMTGQDLAKIKNLEDYVKEIGIYARVNPEHKQKIVTAFQKHNHVVAMTGDGVNDAPALKRADIGIAMGITGTDVSKEASDMILTDDNFASIVNAIEEGRGIYDNIKKFLKYLLSSNTGEVLTMFIGILTLKAGGKTLLPLLALHLLWINIVTDGAPAISLSVDPISKDVMQRKPSKKSEPIITKSRGLDLFFIGIIMAAGTLIAFNYGMRTNYVYATTIAFCTLVFYQMFNVFNCRSEKSTIFKVKRNNWLLLAVTSSITLQLIVIYTPLNVAFKTTQLQAFDWIVVILLSSTVLIYGELYRLMARLKWKKSNSQN